MRFCPRCGERYEHERFCPEDGVATEPLPHAGPPKDALIGHVVDARYRVDAQIGEGGMGVVYRATHITLNKTLALKVLRGEMARDPDVVQRFIQEAQAATSIGHENIIDISDFGRLPDGTVYFVMEYLNGQPLNDLIRRGGSIPTLEAVAIIRQIASALGAAHARGIIHRDLKPDNVYVVPRGEQTSFVKVLDFGIAKVGGASNKLTQTGMVFGTPHYMSPEQAAGQSVDARTDIYALGVIMYEMFTGRVPFDADTFMGILTKHMFEEPPPMNVPGAERMLGALEQITMRALAKKPEHRYQSMEELVEDLDRVVGGGLPRSMNAAAASAALADALEPRTRSEMDLARRLGGRNRGIDRRLLWAGVGMLLSGVLLGVLLWPGGERPAASAGAAPPSLPPPPPSLPPPLPRAEPQPVLAAPAPAAKPADTPGALSVVLIRSEPSGATLIMDGAIVGHTPAEFPRPDSGSRLIELRLDGYQHEKVRISAGAPSELRVVLRKRTAAQPQPAQAARPSPAPPSAASKASRRERPKSEVIDPWE